MAGKRKKDETAGTDVPRKKLVSDAVPASEDADFPRGGASALTPAEIREARSQADAEFDQEKKHAKKRREGKGDKEKGGTGEEDALFGGILSGKLPSSVEILRYKGFITSLEHIKQHFLPVTFTSLCVGMKIWGAVADINNKDLVISLPGGLRGFVLAEEASEVFAKTEATTRKTKKLSTKEDSKNIHSGTEAGEEEDEIPLLSDLFNVGQLVACTVCKLELSKGKKEDGKPEKKGRRIELSLNLSTLHKGLTIDSLHDGQVLTAIVTSVEDHGYLLSFGVPAMSGFLLHRNFMDGNEASKLRKGQLVHGVVISIDKKRGTVGLKASPVLVASNMVKEFAGLTLELLMPGSMVNVRVRAVIKNGLLLSFLTYFTGTVDIFHLEVPLLGSKWSEKYVVNQRLKARILYVDPNAKTVGLTLNPQLLNYTTPSMDVEVGDVIPKAIVRRVDATIGMLLELPAKDSPAAGYVHISNVSDEHITKLEKKYREGKKVRARVIGFRVMDALAVASLKESVVEQLLLSHSDVKPAMIVQGTVAAVESFGAFVQLADGLRALCPLQHMSEFQRSTPSVKFQVGAKMKFRVLVCSHQTKKITVTHKKTLVTSKLTPITSYEDAVEGLVTHGFITGIEDYGCFVSFYNDVKGLVHKSQLGIEAGVNAETVYQVGQSIKCRVLRSDPSTCRLSLSFVTTSTRDGGVEGEHIDMNPGDIVSGTVAYVGETVIVVDITTPKGMAKGYLTFPHLSDSLGHIEPLKAVMKVGLKLDRLLVLEITDKEKLIVSAKFSLLQAAALLPSDISQLQPQSVIPGYIANITERGCFVRFLGRLTGLASTPQVADEFVSDPNNHFRVGQSVRAQVLEVNQETGKFSLCLKQSVSFSTDASLIHGYFLEEEKIVEASGASNLEWTENLAVGTCVDGEIQEIKDYGVIVNVKNHKDVVGFVTHYQLSGSVEVGKSVQARVLDVVKADGIVDLTLRSELLHVTNTEALKSKKEKHKKRVHSTGTLELHQKVTAVVELVKDEYLVLSLADQGSAIGFASTGDFNLRPMDSHQRYRPGQRLVAIVQVLAEEATGKRILLLLSTFRDSQSTSSSAKRPRLESKYEVGALIEAEVVSIEQPHLIVQVSKTMQGHVHITQVRDEYKEGNPLSAFTVGQKVTGRVVMKSRAKTSNPGRGGYILELTLRPSQLSDIYEADMGTAKSSKLPAFETMVTGQEVTAYVQEVAGDWAWLLVAPHLRGRLFVLDSSNNPEELENFKERFKVGTPVSCRVKAIDHEKETLDLTLKDTVHNMKIAEFEVPPVEGPDPNLTDSSEKVLGFREGSVVGGRVAQINPGVGGLSVQIAPALFGRVHVTHLDDVWRDDPAAGFKEGQFVGCVILEVGKSFSGRPQVDLSLRASLGGSSGATLDSADMDLSKGQTPIKVDSIQDLKEGLQVQGFVKNATNKGCFVSLAPHLDARVLISNLSDSFVKDPSESFPPGKLVTGRILSVEPLSGRVDMTFKSTDGRKTTAGSLLGRRFEDFKVGDIVFGTIKRIESFGLFVSLEHSSVVAMCHVSEIADHYVKHIDKHYKVSDRVRARILKADSSNDRISLGLKDSYFPETVDKVESESEQAAADMDEPEVIATDGAARNASIEEEDSEVELEAEAGTQVDEGVTEERSDGGEDSGEEVDEHEEESESDENPGEICNFSLEAPPLEVQLDEDLKPAGLADSTNEEESAEKDGSEEKEKLTKRSKKRLKEEREKEIRAAEEKRLKGDQAPETVDDFEALVRTSPNSSFVWIKYMAFMLQLADVDKARTIAERALTTINYREESEKLNVWIAFLNLENAYGDPPKEAVLELFQRALQYNEPKKLYFALLGIYENPKQPQGPQHDMVDQVLKTMTRKFNTSAKVWVKQIQILLARGKGDAAHKALDQSLLSLPRRKHIKVISRAALLEFKIGSVERARSMFEGILRNYPKRTDLWSVYLDQEIRVGEVSVIRALFERVICLELPPRKMKFLFKKYLDYEKAHGEEARVEHVKKKAMDYVDNKLS